MDNLTVKVENGVQELVIRQGDAFPLKEPKPLQITGRIDSILNWLKVRKTEINEKNCHIIVNYDKLVMGLMIDERDVQNHASIGATLELSEEYKKFGINSSKQWEPYEFSKFIKMNRALFVSKDQAAILVTDFKNFKAKVDKVVEKMKDQNGSYDEKRSQAVTTNLPENFKVKIPIFKGEEAITLELEVEIDSTTLAVSLISPEANEFVQTTSREKIDEQIKLIHDLCPSIAIIYQ